MTEASPPEPDGAPFPLKEPLLGAFILIAITLSVLRATRVVRWPWPLVLIPFTIAGVVAVGVWLLSLCKQQFDEMRGLVEMVRDNTPGSALPPPQLEAPLCADDPGDRILAQHPELLAALCLGFRMKRLQPTILGKPVTDAWGVYSKALTASSLEFDEVRYLAKKHARAYAELGKTKLKKAPSDAMVMRRAVDQFRRCAEKTAKRGGNPDCPFEHVTVIYGTRIPSRDATLKSLAPRVRSLLEQQYPQLATATLADGSHVKYAEWQRQAAEGRKEVARVQREGERLSHRLDETMTELADARAQRDVMQREMDRVRQEAQSVARAEQQNTVDELLANSERARQEQSREVQRMAAELAKHAATIGALTAERDELERAVLASTDESSGGDAAESIGPAELAGLRVLLVGGDARLVGPIRDFAESFGVQLLHDDTMNATQLVAGVDIVVFWIRYISHPKYFGVRRECRVTGTTHCYWFRTSNSSLMELIAATRRIA